MNALNTHPYRSKPPRSAATRGMIVITASASAAMKVVLSTRPVVSPRCSGAHSPGAEPLMAEPLMAEPLMAESRGA